jgi:hypothetical protein
MHDRRLPDFRQSGDNGWVVVVTDFDAIAELILLCWT